MKISRWMLPFSLRTLYLFFSPRWGEEEPRARTLSLMKSRMMMVRVVCLQQQQATATGDRFFHRTAATVCSARCCSGRFRHYVGVVVTVLGVLPSATCSSTLWCSFTLRRLRCVLRSGVLAFEDFSYLP